MQLIYVNMPLIYVDMHVIYDCMQNIYVEMHLFMSTCKITILHVDINNCILT